MKEPLIVKLKGFAPPREFFNLFKDKPFSFLLESALLHNGLGRFSFIGWNPFLMLKSKKGRIEIKRDTKTENFKGNPFETLRKLLNIYKIKRQSYDLPFFGGAVGYFGYDLKHFIERLPDISREDINVPDLFIMFYSSVLIFDHLEKEIFISSTGFPEMGSLRRKKAQEEISRLKKCLQNYNFRRDQTKQKEKIFIQINSNFKKEDYILAIKKAKEYIREGDIYQVNLSQRFSCKIKEEPFRIYERLSRINPSCFSSFFNLGDFYIISASPERFLRLKGNLVQTRPMKGTRPRGKTEKEDEILKRDLLKSKKDKAELMMIVDLERNDLGRVCDYGSIRVKSLRNLEAYSTVYQTTADVTGTLREGKDRIDLIKACFPGGSITGAPKIRAMEIIEELEPTKRNVYTGSIGYLGFDGDMDLNIIIRTILIKDGKAYLQAGGGIVADSIPELEFDETLTKARALFSALKIN
ncbi:MAG: aminodeoxychorismate synthase component I [Candidatus Omnitrophica bacterium]|nr:aminodeoxychorismate synthase component I [Candidatus Omnitrophota bacterium]